MEFSGTTGLGHLADVSPRQIADRGSIRRWPGSKQATLARFADQEGIAISQAFVDCEWKHDDGRRPQLNAALAGARVLKTLISVTKL
jgi:hypothetical protein